MKKFLKYATLIVAVLCVSIGIAACGDDKDDVDSTSIVGTWTYSEDISDSSYDYSLSFEMTLTFNSDHTGRLVQTTSLESRSESNNISTMNFEWSTTTDSNGNDILKISYVSGDKDTYLFSGSNVVLWSRQYVLTGNTLNVYATDGGVWVFKRK